MRYKPASQCLPILLEQSCHPVPAGAGLRRRAFDVDALPKPGSRVARPGRTGYVPAMRLSLHRIRRSRGLRIMAALACLMLVLTSAPVMASSMPMPGMANMTAMQASMPSSSQHLANSQTPVGQMPACCQGQGGQPGTTVCQCPVMCGSMLPSLPAMSTSCGHAAVIYPRLMDEQGPSPAPRSRLRPPIA